VRSPARAKRASSFAVRQLGGIEVSFTGLRHVSLPKAQIAAVVTDDRHKSVSKARAASSNVVTR
jgi:hypothetical protein